MGQRNCKQCQGCVKLLILVIQCQWHSAITDITSDGTTHWAEMIGCEGRLLPCIERLIPGETLDDDSPSPYSKREFKRDA